MKHIFLIFFFTQWAIRLSIQAQVTPIQKYELSPSSMQEVYIDHVQSTPCRTFDIGSNQFIGQVDKDHHLYGYGMFINGDGSQIIGQFRNDELLFGITLTQNAALVGSRHHYASYSLGTGRLEFVFRSNERVLLDTTKQLYYGFVSMTYANGDQYVGEVYQRKRHGYGIYYYANGDFWFGQYNNDIRQGHGALFKVDGDMYIGEWQGEDEKRVVFIRKK